VAAARNAGIRRARGQVLAFLDADDLWLPRKLERQIDVLRRHPQVEMVFTDGSTFAEDGDVHPSILGHLSRHFDRVRPWLPGLGDAGRVVVRPGRPDLLFCNFVYTPGVVVRWSCLEAVGGFDESLATCEDYDLWLRIARRAPLALVNEVLFRCRLREAGSLGGPRALRGERFFETEWRVRERHLLREDREVRRALRRLRGAAYLRSGWQELHAGRLAPARAAFWRSLRSGGQGHALLYLMATLLPGGAIRRLRGAGEARPLASGNG
jgi:glycosyltransferase involved in cell wall biosynthesis